MPASASDMCAKDVQAVITNMAKEDKLTLDVDDEVIGELLATKDGEIISNRLRSVMKLPERKPAADSETTSDNGAEGDSTAASDTASATSSTASSQSATSAATSVASASQSDSNSETKGA